LLDILNIYFLTKFTQKPLRFYGLVGLVIGSVGALISIVLALMRLFGGVALADRPLLLLGVLLVVLGVQMVSIGLIGEIVIFLSPRKRLPAFREVSGGAGDDPGDAVE